MDYVPLTDGQVAAAALLIAVNISLSAMLELKLERSMLIASVRTIVQLVLIGAVLREVFACRRLETVVILALFMTAVAGFAAVRQIPYRYSGIWSTTFVSIAASAWTVTSYAMVMILGHGTSWFEPQYVIPILGMILGNTLTGISLGLSRFTSDAVNRRDQIELLLTLGATRWEAARPTVRLAIRDGMVPTINAMMVVGLVSLPGMMTGQLLSGVDPSQAIKYQIVIVFLIAAGTGLGTTAAVLLSFRRLFNSYHQFRYELLDAYQ